MKMLNRLSVGQRQQALAITSALMLCLCVMVGLTGIRQLATSSEKAFVAKDVVADILPPPLYLIEARLTLSLAVEGTLSLQQAEAQLQQLAHNYNTRVKYWRDAPPYGLEALLLGPQHEQAQQFWAAAEGVLVPLRAGDAQAARAALGELHRIYLSHRAGVDKTVAVSNRMAESAMESFGSTATRSHWALLGILGLAVVCGGAVAWLVARSIIKPLGEAVALAREVAEGNLAAAVVVAGGGEAAQLQRALNAMSASLAGVVGQVRKASSQVAVASRQLAAANAEMQQRTHEQSVNMKRAYTTLREITSFVADNAAASDQVKALAAEAGQSSDRGKGAVTELSDSMAGVTRSSAEVAEMVGFIQSVAFQTNLLALNASVEAARAGEQGRGFAVVAAEVRQLAQRVASAAEDIRLQVDATRQAVAHGSAGSDSAGRALHDMASIIQRMSGRVEGIWETTFAQTSAINMLVETVAELSQSAESNAAMVTQAATLAGELQRSAAELDEVVSRFTLSSGGVKQPAVAAP
jgi:methyl-accepting chemotaxis protein